MDKSPIFTIVTPSFNQGKFLQSTIESVISQAGDFFIDYIIADGGSVDDSVDVIRRFDRALSDGAYPIACRGVTLRWWSRKDAGQSDAINQGFREATGDFVAWLNSDDLYQPGALRGAAAAMATHPSAGMVYSNWVVIDEGGREIERHVATPFDLDFELNCGNLVPQPAVFLRRSALERVGLLDPRYHYAMDYDLWIRIAKQFPVVSVDEWWAAFRLHGESKSVALADKFWREERAIVRSHGGRFFSRMYANHIAKRWPRTMKLLFRMEKALGLIRRGAVRELGMGLKKSFRPPPISR